MIRNSIAFLAATLIGASSLPAQKADPFSAEVRQMYDHVKANLTKLVEKMPEEDEPARSLPEEVESSILKALQPAEGDRPPTIGAFVQELVQGSEAERFQCVLATDFRPLDEGGPGVRPGRRRDASGGRFRLSGGRNVRREARSPRLRQTP